VANDLGFLNVEQVARRLFVSDKTIYKAIRSGELAAVRPGRMYRGVRRLGYAEDVTVARPPSAVVKPTAPLEIGSLERLREIEGQAA
jgi:excisionase family DNA binding protein